MRAEERAERMYPESDITYGFGAVREAYVAGVAEARAEVERLQGIIDQVRSLDTVTTRNLNGEFLTEHDIDIFESIEQFQDDLYDILDRDEQS